MPIKHPSTSLRVTFRLSAVEACFTNDIKNYKFKNNGIFYSNLIIADLVLELQGEKYPKEPFEIFDIRICRSCRTRVTVHQIAECSQIIVSSFIQRNQLYGYCIIFFKRLIKESYFNDISINKPVVEKN